MAQYGTGATNQAIFFGGSHSSHGRAICQAPTLERIEGCRSRRTNNHNLIDDCSKDRLLVFVDEKVNKTQKNFYDCSMQFPLIILRRNELVIFIVGGQKQHIMSGYNLFKGSSSTFLHGPLCGSSFYILKVSDEFLERYLFHLTILSCYVSIGFLALFLWKGHV